MVAPPHDVPSHRDMLATAAATVFASLSEIARQRLITAGNLRDFAAGATLFRTGDPPPGLFIVLSGQVRVLRSRDGRQRVMHSEGPGGTLGEVPLFEGGTMPATAEAVTDVCCLVIAKDALLAIIRDDPSVALLFLQRLAGRVRGLVERLDSASTQSVVGRLASYVLAQAAISESASFTLGLTQEALAEELGTVREVVVRGLANLRRDGVIASVGKGRYTVRDAAALRRLAE